MEYRAAMKRYRCRAGAKICRRRVEAVLRAEVMSEMVGNSSTAMKGVPRICAQQMGARAR